MKTVQRCITHFSTTMNKHLTLGGKGESQESRLLWLTVSEGSVHSLLVTCIQQNITDAKACSGG